MDIITDLTSQAVSFITVLQDICRNDDSENQDESDGVYLWDVLNSSVIIKAKCIHRQTARIREIIWYGTDASDEIITDHFSLLSDKLLSWLQKQFQLNELKGAHLLEATKINKGCDSTAPYYWRKCIRYILYNDPNERLRLIEALDYMPIQVIMCLGGNNLVDYERRLYQVITAVKNQSVLPEQDKQSSRMWWDEEYKDRKRWDRAFELIKDDKDLLDTLLLEENTIPFELLFNDELSEISKSREKRLRCWDELKNSWDNWEKSDIEKVDKAFLTNDPLVRADRMELYGLAFSGGGIRSATFNLGILQKLAEKDILQRMDYISTVSGGGYIGSWLVSWIKRAGSLSKVSERLNTKKSADPMADEVRPVRWLRMYSNYLAPDASIMSADSWTVGITWLRNTLIN